jgi:hypothetical protein
MNISRTNPFGIRLDALLRGRRISRGTTWGLMILGALLAFEIFNYSTTEFALQDVLGDLRFAGIRWATILSIAFCGIDFAGIARLFTPEQGRDEPAEVWYLFGAWILAAAMNATLTWWGVSLAIAGHQSQGSAVMGTTTVTKVVPVFVALMVWVIRILIIGTFSVAGERLFSQAGQQQNYQSRNVRPSTPAARPQPVMHQAASSNTRPAAVSSIPGLRPASSLRPAPKPQPRPEPNFRPEPTYHNLNGARPSYQQTSFSERNSNYDQTME